MIRHLYIGNCSPQQDVESHVLGVRQIRHVTHSLIGEISRALEGAKVIVLTVPVEGWHDWVRELPAIIGHASGLVALDATGITSFMTMTQNAEFMCALLSVADKAVYLVPLNATKTKAAYQYIARAVQSMTPWSQRQEQGLLFAETSTPVAADAPTFVASVDQNPPMPVPSFGEVAPEPKAPVIDDAVLRPIDLATLMKGIELYVNSSKAGAQAVAEQPTSMAAPVPVMAPPVPVAAPMPVVAPAPVFEQPIPVAVPVFEQPAPVAASMPVVAPAPVFEQPVPVAAPALAVEQPVPVMAPAPAPVAVAAPVAPPAPMAPHAVQAYAASVAAQSAPAPVVEPAPVEPPIVVVTPEVSVGGEVPATVVAPVVERTDYVDATTDEQVGLERPRRTSVAGRILLWMTIVVFLTCVGILIYAKIEQSGAQETIERVQSIYYEAENAAGTSDVALAAPADVTPDSLQTGDEQPQGTAGATDDPEQEPSASEDPENPTTPQPAATPAPQQTAAAPKVAPGLNALLAINPDTVGWIKVPGTKIDYPVVRSDNNDYYLNHSFYKESSRVGTVFIDNLGRVSPASSSQNLAVFGHKSSLFNSLQSYQKLAFYKQNPTFTFDTLHEKGQWVIFAVFLTNSSPNQDEGNFFEWRHPDFYSRDEYMDFIRGCKERSLIDTTVQVSPGDALCSMTTCSTVFKDARLVVMARKLQPGEQVDVSGATTNREPLYPQAWYDKYGGEKPAFSG